MIKVLIKWEELDTGQISQGGHQEKEYWSYVATNLRAIGSEGRGLDAPFADLQRECGPADTGIEFGLQPTVVLERINVGCLNHTVCGTLLHQDYETNTGMLSLWITCM